MNRISFDEKVEQYLNERIEQLKKLGIKNPSKPDALRTLIEENRVAQLKMKRKRCSKYGLLFK